MAAVQFNTDIGELILDQVKVINHRINDLENKA